MDTLLILASILEGTLLVGIIVILICRSIGGLAKIESRLRDFLDRTDASDDE